MMTDEQIKKLRDLGSDGTFEEDLKTILGCQVLAGMNTLADLHKITDDIVALHEWHENLIAKQS